MPTPPTVAMNFIVSAARFRRDTGRDATLDTLPIVTYTVYLDSLSQQAQHAVQHGLIPQAHGLPLVLVRLPAKTVREFITNYPQLNPYPPPALAANFPTFGLWLESPPLLQWSWTVMRNDSTPEAYLNTEVNQILHIGEILPVSTAQQSEWLDTAAVAAELGVLPREVRRQCAVGLFPSAAKRGGAWYIQRRDLAHPAIQARPRGYPRGRPRDLHAEGAYSPNIIGATIAASITPEDYAAWQECQATSTTDQLVQRYGPFRLRHVAPYAKWNVEVVWPG